MKVFLAAGLALAGGLFLYEISSDNIGASLIAEESLDAILAIEPAAGQR